MLVPADIMAAKLIGQMAPIPPLRIREVLLQADAAPDSTLDLISRLAEFGLLHMSMVSTLRRYLAYFAQARYQIMCLRLLRKHDVITDEQIHDVLANLESSPYHSHIGVLLVELGHLRTEEAQNLEYRVRQRMLKEDFAVLQRYRKESFAGITKPLISQTQVNTSVFRASTLFVKPAIAAKIDRKIRELIAQRKAAEAAFVPESTFAVGSMSASQPRSGAGLKAFVRDIESSLDSALEERFTESQIESVQIDEAEALLLDTARFKRPSSTKTPVLRTGKGPLSSARPQTNEEPEADDGAINLGELEEIGPYDVIECLGQGGMGAVYMGRNVENGSMAAVKVLHATRADAENLARFSREADITGMLDHPNLIRLIERGKTEEGLAYMGISLCAGKPLEKILDEGPMDPGLAFHIFEQVLDGLDHVHRKNLIHRDLKPENIFVQAGKEKVATIMDFGLARLIDDGKEVANRAFRTKAGIVSGSPAYIAPETISGDSLDSRTDIYSLGVLFYRMLTGKMPLFAETPYDYLREHLIGIPMTLFQGHRQWYWCPEIETLMARMLAKEKGDRPESCAIILAIIRGGLRDKTLELLKNPPETEHQKGKTSMFNNFFKRFKS
jgi:hypothetical protein